MTVSAEQADNRPAGCIARFAAPGDPCTIVIIGASGDLTARKLMPALYNLYKNRLLPEPVNIIGCSRTSMTDEEFREKLADGRPVAGDAGQWEKFAGLIHYRAVAYDSPATFAELAGFINELDKRSQTRGNRLFYLAIPPSQYQAVAEMLGQAGLSKKGISGSAWSRIVVEKPFGRDLESALELDRTLHRSFAEEQIFRIDHYLAKETVQNILMFRFANAIFEPLWNRNYIDYVGIAACEKLGVEHRAGYYEQSGVIRDMFQNHLMQLLALTAMEPPSHFDAAPVQEEKIQIFRALKPFSADKLQDDLILGQYGPGRIDGRDVPAYREEPGVDPASTIPTFAIMRLFIDNWRWRDVPFYMVSGKRMPRKTTRIIIQFKNVPHSIFRNVLAEKIVANRLVLSVFPQEEISLTFQAKSPGSRDSLRSVTMDFNYDRHYSGPNLEAYEKVLMDCIRGDHMLFWHQDGVELSWSFLTPILQECDKCQAKLLNFYDSGSWGPSTALKWMRLIIADEDHKISL